jgi:hypothetical protein
MSVVKKTSALKATTVQREREREREQYCRSWSQKTERNPENHSGLIGLHFSDGTFGEEVYRLRRGEQHGGLEGPLLVGLLHCLELKDVETALLQQCHDFLQRMCTIISSIKTRFRKAKPVEKIRHEKGQNIAIPHLVELRLPCGVPPGVHPDNDVFDPARSQHFLCADKGLVLKSLHRECVRSIAQRGKVSTRLSDQRSRRAIDVLNIGI